MRVILEAKEKEKEGEELAYKIPVFGLLKRGGKVYVKMINNTKISTLMPIIRQKVQPDSIVYSDYYHSYDVLDVSEFLGTLELIIVKSLLKKRTILMV